MTKHEAKRLQNCHQAENDANGAGGAFSEGADKVGVGHIVDAGNQHTGYGGQSQLHNQLWNGRLRHFQIFFIMLVLCGHPVSSPQNYSNEETQKMQGSSPRHTGRQKEFL